jgi:hypothetical protein
MAETTYGKDRTRKESRGLLDDEELNLGSSAVIPVPFARPFTENDVKAGNPVRLVDLKTDSRLGFRKAMRARLLIRAAQLSALLSLPVGLPVLSVLSLTFHQFLVFQPLRTTSSIQEGRRSIYIRHHLSGR